MKIIPISEEWLELKAIKKTAAHEWEIPINEGDNDIILIKISGGHFEAFHQIDNNTKSRKMYYTEEIEQLYTTLTGKNL